MLSDESSSDSETGRFKGRSEKSDQQNRTSGQRQHNIRSSGRDRHSENDRIHRDLNRRREEKDRFDRVPRDRYRFSRNSPIRRRHSNDRSPIRKRSRERHLPRRTSRERSKTEEHRSSSRDQQLPSRSTRPHRQLEPKRDIKEEIKRDLIKEENNSQLASKYKRSDKFDRGTRDNESSSPEPEIKVNRSEIHKPTPEKKNKSESPPVEKDCDSNNSEEVQPGSYYSMKPTVIKDKSEGTSEIDSSDDEKLRAKLLNLEKELHQAKKKKHKKKHRKKEKSSKDEKDLDTPTTTEVSSTTDIKNKVQTDTSSVDIDATEVTSTQKNSQVESNEEGEILSDDDSHNGLDIDPTDLRHKLKRSVVKVEPVELIDLGGKVSSKAGGVCGPALPPHLVSKSSKHARSNAEGPALPPHLRKGDRKIGPSIPDQLRKELAQNDCEIIKCESSDDDGIGPLPAGAESKWSDAHRQLEERALDIKIRNMDGHSMRSSKIKSREQWMLELPEGKTKYMGLEARTFRAKEGPDMSNRSSWTDTPEEKSRKQAGLEKEEDPDVLLQREARARQLHSRDEEQEKAVKKHKKKHKREESLLEMHEKKLKKKKKKADKDEKQERRPFSRDVDLQVNRFDEAQKKSVIKKAQMLDARFSRGEAKYL